MNDLCDEEISICTKSGMSTDEQVCMDHLMQALKLFQKFDHSAKPNELTEWIRAINTQQDLLALRVLRRHFPEYWGKVQP